MSTRNPLFSVIIPAFNAEATVASTLMSALGQSLSDLELIVVNDGSTDHTAAIVEQVDDPRVRLHSQPNGGLSAARNAGISVARGRFIAFLDSDDLWLPRYLELAERALEGAPRPGLVYTDAHPFDPVSGKVCRRSASWDGQPGPSRPDAHRFLFELLERNFVWVSTIVPRTVLEELGGFNQAANPAEDYELWLRITVKGYDVAWIPGQQGLYRRHDGQMSRDEVKMRRGELTALMAIHMEDMPTAAHREVLARRRREVEREIRLLDGRASRTATSARRLRRRLSRLRERIGLGERWTKSLPADVAAVFPDLTAV